MIIGVTGLIGSGKSEVAAVFGTLGAQIIDADRLGQEVVDSDSVVFYQLINKFGQSILDKDLNLNRRRLGELAFSSKQKTELLNSIVHPGLLKRLDSLVDEARAKKRVAVVDAALLIYWNYHKSMDYTILVSSFQRLRTKRMLDRGMTPEEVGQRIRSQQKVSCLRKHADHVITNNKDLAGLRIKSEILYRRLTKRG